MPEYGVLIYDVPKGNERLYRKIRGEVYQRSVMLNYSVYLIPWAMKNSMEGILHEAFSLTGQEATVNIIKFDGCETERVERMAKQALNTQILDSVARVRRKIREEIEEGKRIGERYLDDVYSRLRALENVITIFGFSEDLDGVLRSSKEAIDLVWEARIQRLRLSTVATNGIRSEQTTLF